MDNSDPKRPADPTGETTPQRKSNDSGGRKTVAEHLIDRDAESDPRIGERRPESEARETSDGSLRKDGEAGYRNTDEI
jgi:hypothetical protein